MSAFHSKNPPHDQAYQSNPVGITPLSGRGKPAILMCPPDHFTVAYAINPWMEPWAQKSAPPTDGDRARRQWDALYDAITERAGADVHLLTPVAGLPDFVFTANAAFIYNDTAVIARYKYPERRGEEPYCERWFADQGFRVVTMPESIFFEGAGDALIWQDRVFAGYKTRTDIASHSLLPAATGLPVLSLEMVDPRFYHVDVCLCPLEDGHFIYSPAAFDDYGNTVIEANVPPEKRIRVTPDEATLFACNAVNIGKTVIFNQGSARLADTLKGRGFEVIQLDLGEFLKAGGSAKCLTLRIA